MMSITSLSLVHCSSDFAFNSSFLGTMSTCHQPRAKPIVSQRPLAFLAVRSPSSGRKDANKTSRPFRAQHLRQFATRNDEATLQQPAARSDAHAPPWRHNSAKQNLVDTQTPKEMRRDVWAARWRTPGWSSGFGRRRP